MLKVGISGKIASGKSEVEKFIQQSGFLVFDLDVISHELLEKDEKVKTQVLNEFKTLKRKELSKIIFNDENKKQMLEKIIHSKHREIIFEIFEKHKNERAIFISGALLFKSDFYKYFDKTIFVNADENIRLLRLMKRNNLSKSEAQKLLNLQDDGELADYIIENNSDILNLEYNTKKVLEEIF